MCVDGFRSRVRIGDMLSDPSEVNSGLKQRDVISPVLFKFALDKVIRTAKISVKLFSPDGSRLLPAFADDIDVVGNTVLTVKDLFLSVETQAEQIGLRVNEDKIKYILTSRTGRRVGKISRWSNTISRGSTWYAFKSVLESKKYKTIIRSKVMNTSETWTLTKDNERKLRTFERKVVRKIFGFGLVWSSQHPITQQYQIRTNQEISELYKDIQSRYSEGDKGKKAAMGRSCAKTQGWVRLPWEGASAGRRPPPGLGWSKVK